MTNGHAETTVAEDGWVPEYLSREQVVSLYDQALVQAEVQVANAWINYDGARARLARLQADRKRLLDL